MVHKSILKRIAIPVGVIASSVLFTGYNKAYAASTDSRIKQFINNGKVSENKFYNEDFGKYSINNLSDQWIQIGESISNTIQWFKDLPANTAKWSVDLLGWVYQMTSDIVLTTPLWLFQNTWFKDTSLVFGTISISVMVILMIIEGIKQMMKQKHTDLSTTMKRIPLALGVSGFAPYAFEQVFKLINKLSDSITQIGVSEIHAGDIMTASRLSGADTAALLGFDIALIGLLFPIFLHCGRRWFDLLSLASMTPLAMTAFCFDSYKHLHNQWWSNVKRLSLIQLVYAIFICIIGIFIFGTRNTMDGNGLMIKYLIVIGGLWRMANPPGFVKRYADQGTDTIGMVKGFVGAMTFKNLSPAKQLVGKLIKKK